MATIKDRESETLEFKREWTDRALQDLAAFANTEGGRLLLGIRDDGEVVGMSADDKEIQRMTNIIAAQLGITPSVRTVEIEGRPVVEIRVEPSPGLVPCGGRYLRRVGTTNRDFRPDQLARHILERSGHSWDALASGWTLDEVDPETVNRFARLARSRLPQLDSSSMEQTLENLQLLESGKLKNAGVLLFGKEPQRLFPLVQVRIGIFRGSEILDSHDFRRSLWEQLDGAMERFRQVLKVRFDTRVEEPTLEGLRRREIWEYPLEALREALINALIHRDYMMPADIQIKIHEDSLEIWNAGELPSPLRPEDLRGPHRSVLRNPLIAQVFYFAGLIERWGSGTLKIMDLCRQQGLPEPMFENQQGGFLVTFAKDPYTPERLRAMGLNERQIQAVLYVKEKGRISNQEHQKLAAVSKRTASRDLEHLVCKNVFERVGETGKGTYYVLKGSQRGQRGQNGATKGPKGFEISQ